MSHLAALEQQIIDALNVKRRFERAGETSAAKIANDHINDLLGRHRSIRLAEMVKR